MIRFASIPLPVDITSIQQEVLQLTSNWMPHLNKSHYTGHWDVTSLRSPGGTAGNSVPDVLSPGQAFADTPLMQQCPAIHALIDSLHCEVMAVRLLNLKSGATIKPHRDFDLCFEKGEARLHIPVFTSNKVSFYSENELIPMQEGQCWYINANITHSVANNGDTDRIHLVIDCVVNDWVEALFATADKNEVPDAPDVPTTLAMIAALKTHGTTQADALAASLQAKLDTYTGVTPKTALANWLPYKLHNGTDVQWLYSGLQPYTDPFFDETISKCRSLPENSHLKRSMSTGEMLREWSFHNHTLAPSAIIFHVSRCGSTLLAQLLGLNTNNIVLAEVPFFDDLLRARYKKGGQDMSHLLPDAVSFYAQKRRGNENRLFIKADSWHLFFYEQLRALYPGIPFILLYRRPDEVIASQEKKKGMHAVPGVIEKEIFELAPLPDYQHPPNVYVAAVLEQYYEKMQQIQAKDNNAFLVNYKEGFVAITEKVYQLTDTPLTETDREALIKRCSYDAKEPDKKFNNQPADENDISAYMEKAFQGYHTLEQLREKLLQTLLYESNEPVSSLFGR